MKISEKLSEIKRLEGELARLYSRRQLVIEKTFPKENYENKEIKSEEYTKLKGMFMDNKKNDFIKLTKEINKVKEDILEGKNIINKKNIEIGHDKRLIKMKYIMIELSKLMKLNSLTNSRVFYREFDIDILEELNIHEEIKKFEREKAKLDSEIQFTNWNTEL